MIFLGGGETCSGILRIFEMEVVVGVGWLYGYVNGIRDDNL